MRSRPTFRASAPLVPLFFLIVLSGCARTVVPVAPTGDRAPESALRATQFAPEGGVAGGSANLFYPLELGNHWGYDHALTVYIVPIGGPPGPEIGVSDERDRDLVCIEHRAGREYTVEQNSLSGTPPWWTRYRQDAAGLYQLDADPALPPVCAGASARRTFDAAAAMAARNGEAAWAGIAARLTDPARQAAYRAAWDRVQTRASAIRRALGAEGGLPRATGVETGEITQLQYPLHPGTHWVVRADPLFESTVEGADALDLEVGRQTGWRIRINSELFGSQDRVHIWYGRNGYLKLVAHLEGIATDDAGNLIGTVIAEETEVLTELSLDGGRFAAH